MHRPEILAPCGNREAFEAALRAGADAVYLAGNSFGARAYAGNFDKDVLLSTLERAHLFGVKVYLTVNTLFKNEELGALEGFLAPLYEAGLDAVIQFQLFRRTVAGDDDLFISCNERFKGIEEFIDRRFFAFEELDIVDQKNIRLSIFISELLSPVAAS